MEVSQEQKYITRRKAAGFVLLALFIGLSAGLLINSIIDPSEVDITGDFDLTMKDKPTDANMPYSVVRFRKASGETWYARKGKDGVLYWERIVTPVKDSK